MTQRTLLVTGCSSGIGLDAARTMKARGWRVFASCRQQVDCDRLVSEGFESPRIDYTDEATITNGLAELRDATGGRLDALFNNGAQTIPCATEDLPTDALREMFQANVFGWHDLTRQVIPMMRAQGHGRIVQCSSTLGLVTIPWRGAYAATKHAIESLSDAMRLELHGTGIHVIVIEPGPITTPFREKSQPRFERWIDWRNAARRDDYENKLIPRLYDESGKKDLFELPTSAVSAKLIRALERNNPSPRYFVTTPTYIAEFVRRTLPTRLRDVIARNI